MQLIKRGFILVVSMLSVWGANASNEDWMSRLPDTVKVCRVSIPGTHDSGTAGVGILTRHYARTQKLSIAEQWDAGIRFFDLRPKLVGDKLKIYHGPANCHITLNEALSILKQKLEQNPTEFCIVMTNNAGGGQASVDMTMQIIQDVFPPQMLADFKADMRVADTRGRILFLHRNIPSPGLQTPGAVIQGWPGNSLSRHSRLESASGNSALFWVQDCYTSGANDGPLFIKRKWDILESQIRNYSQSDGAVWNINHASGYTGRGARTNIGRMSERINKWLLEYLQENTVDVGIIPMDFPPQELIDAIIFLNTFTTE